MVVEKETQWNQETTLKPVSKGSEGQGKIFHDVNKIDSNNYRK